MFAQTAARPLVTQKVDETKLVVLHGSVHRLAQTQNDKGAVPDSFPVGRVLLMLNRPAERGTALQSFLQGAQKRGGESYHHWITPEQFGEQFGPADSDVQIATTWLSGHGLHVARVTKGKQFVEFSGTAAQLREAFHTEIHQYLVDGKTHYANATDLSIPAALAPLVRGVSPLNDFHAQPLIQVAGPARYSRTTKKTKPQFTFPNPYGTANPYAYAVAPEDFATQYDLGPLYQAGVKGSGQTIGIIMSSNIDLSQVAAYQQLFGLPNNPPQVVIDGVDPGSVSGSQTEAYLDVELSGAVAPEATVNLYIADASSLQDPVFLSALRAVEDNEAEVLNASFGECEQFLGTAGNELWGSLWEQAAAQGQTVMVAAGDTGAICNGNVLGLSGVASTPWNVAVGGTDFYYSDYATGGASAESLWNQTNDSSLGSLKAPLPEQVWDDPYGLDILAGLPNNEDYAGGGGPSACATTTANDACLAGYPKPAWQMGAGVPADGVRDIPDVSLFASNGANLSTYAICAGYGECAPGADNAEDVLLVGGTSAASPAMAGIMALVNEKYGRQGQANFTLYALAAQKPAAFHDITLGSNSVYYVGEVVGYAATAGYDLASGLGSIDANVLVNNWDAVTAATTDTTLKLSSTSFQHGTAVTASSTVTPASGSGTPSGDVALLTNSSLPASAAQGYLTLSNGTGSTSLSSLPGGSYNVTARYGGDGVFGSSTSSPVAVKVTPENSNINFAILYGDQAVTVQSAPFLYNYPLTLSIQPTGVSAGAGKTNGNATGSATFTVDSISATVPLNAEGVASWPVPALAPGNHTASAIYSGDTSFHSSTAQTNYFTVGKGIPNINITILTPSATPTSNVPGFFLETGGTLTMSYQLGPLYGAVTGTSSPPGTTAPTGTITACLSLKYNYTYSCYEPTYSQVLPLTPSNGIYGLYSSVVATFANLPAGAYSPTAVYSGDANWQSYGEELAEEIFVGTYPTLIPSSTALTITPTSISGSQEATYSVTVTGLGSSKVAPTGAAYLYNNGHFLAYAFLSPAASGASSSYSFQLGTTGLWNSGANQIVAVYSGDAVYAGSTSNTVTLNAIQSGGDFTMTPGETQLTVASGGTATVAVGLTSLNNFNGTVAMSCASTSANVSCAASPASVALNGMATATLMLAAPVQTAGTPRTNRRNWIGGGSGLVLASFALCGLLGRRRRAALFCVALLAVVGAVAGCGGGSSGTKTPPPPPSDAGTYSVTVTGTANGIVHSAKITVVVP